MELEFPKFIATQFFLKKYSLISENVACQFLTGDSVSKNVYLPHS